MRDYALNRAMAADSIGTSLISLFRNWRERRQMAKLETCEDHILRGLGITRDDIRWAMRLPLGQNPALALEDRTFRRSRA